MTQDYSKLTTAGAAVTHRQKGGRVRVARYEVTHPSVPGMAYHIMVRDSGVSARAVRYDGVSWRLRGARSFDECVNAIFNRLSRHSATVPIQATQTQKIPTVKYDSTQLMDSINELIDQNGSTTTKEVKEHLRSKGLRAIQDDVSADMDSLARQGALTYTAGSWRTYYRPSSDPTTVAVSAQQVPAPQTPAPKVPAASQAISLVSGVTGVHPSAISGGSRLVEDLGVDSVAYSQIESEFESATGKKMPYCQTVSDIQNAML